MPDGVVSKPFTSTILTLSVGMHFVLPEHVPKALYVFFC